MAAMQKTIDRLTKKHGSLRKAAEALGITPSYLVNLRAGKRVNPSAEVLDKLGLEKVVMYRKVRKGKSPTR